ncbi:MAG TPA: methyltransferase domain-containing protein [Dehalococcoidia bacterium]|nr:methyltransferase domain-containing protein [Dehalococcoidia bacterium]
MMDGAESRVVVAARDYYNSDDADNFYFHVWGGEDIHIGLYESDEEDIRRASRRTVERLAGRLADVGPRTSVLDLGAGYGGAARWLARRYRCHVTCLNLSEAQNRRNRAMNREAGLDDLIEVHAGNFERIPFEDESFGVVWSQDSFLHSGARETVLAAIDRVLEPGGAVVFTDPMQSDDCPPGVLAPVLERIHLQDLGSFGFYRAVARELGWTEVGCEDLTRHLVRHYARVARELERQRARLEGVVSAAYIERMLRGLAAWVEAGERGYLAWGILHFRKPPRLA